MHEYSKFLDMLQAIKTDLSNAPIRRNKKDQQREEKIKYLTNILKTEADMHAGEFLVEMGKENLCPQIGMYLMAF